MIMTGEFDGHASSENSCWFGAVVLRGRMCVCVFVRFSLVRTARRRRDSNGSASRFVVSLLGQLAA